MIPKGAEGIGHLATRIATDMIPKATDAYAGADLGLMAALIGLVAQDFERAADVLVADRTQALDLLRAARPRIEDGALATRIDATLASSPAGLRISALYAEADVILRLLIDTHAAVEDAAETGATWATALDRDLWRFLDAYVARRAYDSQI